MGRAAHIMASQPSTYQAQSGPRTNQHKSWPTQTITRPAQPQPKEIPAQNMASLAKPILAHGQPSPDHGQRSPVHGKPNLARGQSRP
jgi:hypothetical protein